MKLQKASEVSGLRRGLVTGAPAVRRPAVCAVPRHERAEIVTPGTSLVTSVSAAGSPDSGGRVWPVGGETHMETLGPCVSHHVTAPARDR